MKKTEYKIAWFKIDFKRTIDDRLVIVDIGGGQTSGIEGLDELKVRGSFCQTVLKYFDRLFISSCFQDATFQRLILKDFILAARSKNVICKTSDDLQAMLAKKEITSNDMLLFVDQLKTAEIYSVYQHHKMAIPVVSGDSLFHILYRDKSVLYRLQTLVRAQPDYWHYPINTSTVDIDTVQKTLPASKDGYYLKPTNLDVAEGIEVFKTKRELIDHLRSLQNNEPDVHRLESQLAMLMAKVGQNNASIMKLNQASDYYDIQPKVVGKELRHKGEDCDPTGRAFITLVYDVDKGVLIPEINGCSWILPTTATALANIEHSKKFVQANEEDYEWLTSAFLQGYSELFKLCFTQPAEMILTQLCEADAGFQTYCKEMIYDNPRFYVGRNADIHLKKALSDHANENISKFLAYATKFAKEKKFDQALEFGNAAVVFCDTLLDRKTANKWYITVYSTLGAIYCSKQTYDKALEMYEKVREYNPHDQNLIASIKALRQVIKNPKLGSNMQPAW